MPYISHQDGFSVVDVRAVCKKAVSNTGRPGLVDFAIRLVTQPVWLVG